MTRVRNELLASQVISDRQSMIGVSSAASATEIILFGHQDLKRKRRFGRSLGNHQDSHQTNIEISCGRHGSESRTDKSFYGKHLRPET